MSLVFVTKKVLRIWEKKLCKFGVPFFKKHPIFTDFVIGKWAIIIYENSPLDTHLSADNSAGKFHLSDGKISCVRQDISTPLYSIRSRESRKHAIKIIVLMRDHA